MTTLEKMTAKARVKKEMLEALASVIKNKQEHLTYEIKQYEERKQDFEALSEEDRGYYKSFEDYWYSVDRWDYNDYKETVEFIEVADEVIKEMIK